jgi:ribonuclease HII
MTTLGIDEVGRGPWAGPLVIGAVILGDIAIPNLTDSKKLTKTKREELNKIILATAPATALGWVSSTELDQIGLSPALRLATHRALKQIKSPYHEIIIDGTVNFLANTPLSPHVTTLKKADLLIPAVSAASIIAKVARDTYMQNLAATYPHHGFASHVGYGTANHLKAIKTHGLTPEHRRSFRPIQTFSATAPQNPNPPAPPTTKSIGNLAESHTVNHLISNGHTILHRNWHTKLCEIDIISQRAHTIYFTEVKYRRTATHGDGLSAITPEKLRRMHFAATTFMNTTTFHKNYDQILQVASLTGADFTIEALLTLP